MNVILQDQFGCPFSTTKGESAKYANIFSHELVYLGKHMDSIIEGVKKHPDEVILNIFASIFFLYAQTFQALEQASRYIEQASHLMQLANEREKSLYTLATHWKNQEYSHALKQVERHCFKWPKDLTAIKIAEFLFYCKGQKYECKRFLRLTSHCYSEHKSNPYFLSIHAFALELNEKYDESLRTAQEALQLDEKNPWTHHVLAHNYLRKGLIREGIQFLERYAPSWSQFNPLIESHNLWHLALFYFENLDFDQVQQIFKRAHWLPPTHGVNEEIDAASLLWRLDFEEQEDFTQPLWKKLAQSIQDHAGFGAMPFLNIQLCYALLKGGQKEKLNEALLRIDEFIHQQEKEDRFVWKEVGLPLISGSLAFGNGQYEEALHHLEPIIEKVGCVGGSDAQIDLFTQTYLKCLIGAKRFEEAENLLLKMTQGRNLTKLEHKWLAECH